MAMPYRVIYLDPHCGDCLHPDGSMKKAPAGKAWWPELTWCAAPDQNECPECGRAPIRYVIDRRQLRAGENNGP